MGPGRIREVDRLLMSGWIRESSALHYSMLCGLGRLGVGADREEFSQLRLRAPHHRLQPVETLVQGQDPWVTSWTWCGDCPSRGGEREVWARPGSQTGQGTDRRT